MYHEITYQELRRRKIGLLVAIVLVVLACVLAAAVYSFGRSIAREQGAATLRQAVLSSAMQCCAIEGSFPTSVEHLTEHYGLVINENDYLVTYEWLGDNIAPSVVVRVR